MFVAFCFPLLILFVLCLVAIALHVLLRIMASDYPLGLFKLFSIVFYSIGHVRFVHRTKKNRKCVIIYHSWKALELISLWTKDIFRGQSFFYHQMDNVPLNNKFKSGFCESYFLWTVCSCMPNLHMIKEQFI